MSYKRVYAKINLDAISHNINSVRQKVGSSTKIMAVVKADAYGHGAVMVAKQLEDQVDYFGVAGVAEAMELRKNGINKGILLLGYTSPSLFKTVVENDITLTLFDFDSVKLLSSTAKSLGKIAKIHIAVDTGMSRIGYSADAKSADEVKKISGLENILIEGLFSHFATADELDKTAAYKQQKLFDEFVAELKYRGVTIPIKHLSNSAGIMEMGSNYDMVRSGIVTYGLYPSDEVKKSQLDIIPAMEIISHVSYIKTVKKGTGISYGLTYKAERDTKVATLPVGYADGYPRALSNKGTVLINGTECKVLGRVCMDQMMVDVSEVENIKVEDEVIIVGKSSDKFISVEQVANAAGSFNYEFVCGIGRRVPRVYYKDGKILAEVNYLD